MAETHVTMVATGVRCQCSEASGVTTNCCSWRLSGRRGVVSAVAATTMTMLGAVRERGGKGWRGKCHNCDIRDHFARNCRKPKKEQEQMEQALLCNVDDHPGLF